MCFNNKTNVFPCYLVNSVVMSWMATCYFIENVTLVFISNHQRTFIEQKSSSRYQLITSHLNIAVYFVSQMSPKRFLGRQIQTDLQQRTSLRIQMKNETHFRSNATFMF